MSIVYIDTETTGLDPAVHEVWEIAYVIDNDPWVKSAKVIHHGLSADERALEINGYHDRWGHRIDAATRAFEHDLIDLLDGRTLCAANPAFDAAFLKARWGKAPWKYRLFDVEAYAMGALGYDEPRGLKEIAADLRDRGHDIPEPDHTAAADVETLRACHLALRAIYGGES